MVEKYTRGEVDRIVEIACEYGSGLISAVVYRKHTDEFCKKMLPKLREFPEYFSRQIKFLQDANK